MLGQTVHMTLPCRFQRPTLAPLRAQCARMAPLARSRRGVAMPVTCRGPRGDWDFDDDRQSRRRQQGRRRPQIIVTERSMSEYALPAAGLLLAGLLAGPVLGSLVFGAIGIGVAMTAAAATLAVSWTFLPFLVFFLGGGVVFAGAVFAGLFATAAGGLLIFNLLKIGALGAALWLGAKFAESVFQGGEQGSSGSRSSSRASRRPEKSFDPDSTIDVEADTLDDWKDDVMREQRRREEELREFDELLKRREAFKNKKNY